MNIVELYQKMPVERHKDIRVVRNRVFVKTPKNYFGDGIVRVLQFGIGDDESLFLISNADIKDNVLAKLIKEGILKD